MKLRPLLGAVLGLMVMVQGVAVASAPLGVPLSEPAEAGVELADAGDAMPCHGATPAPAEAPASAPCACCDGDCPDMAACAFGHFAAAPILKLAFAPAPQPAIATRDRVAASVSLPSRLRPPIVLHA